MNKKSTMKVMDHEGNVFSSIAEMCRHWGVGVNTYNHRMKVKGFSLEEALTTPVKRLEFKDHLDSYPPTSIFDKSIFDKDYYCYNSTIHKSRRKRGWSLEKILTTPILRSQVTDHEGNVFSSIAEMCRHWGVGIHTYKYRMMVKGFSLQEALTTPVKKMEMKDHLDSYSPTSIFVKEYNLDHTPYKRRRKQVTDHKGNIFSSIAALCDYYMPDMRKKYLTNPFDVSSVKTV